MTIETRGSLGLDVAETVESIRAVQLDDGMIPWFPGGHADPWNHIEAAMALGVGGALEEAERAFEWLAGYAASRRCLAHLLPCRRAGRRAAP